MFDRLRAGLAFAGQQPAHAQAGQLHPVAAAALYHGILALFWRALARRSRYSWIATRVTGSLSILSFIHWVKSASISGVHSPVDLAGGVFLLPQAQVAEGVAQPGALGFLHHLSRPVAAE